MILVDVNLPIHAINTDSPFHAAARNWWDEQLSGAEPVGLAWVTILGFIRIATTTRVFMSPLAPDEAYAYVDSWLAQPLLRIVDPLEDHWDLVKKLLAQAGTAGNLTTDAHLAALAIQHGCRLCSTDSDFARFAGLEWVNPIRIQKSV